MPLKPMFTVSGYRGIWGESLTEEIAIQYAKAFARFLKEDQKNENPTVLVGRDGRESGPIIKKAIIPELIRMGVNVVDGDILPTPTMLFSVRKHGYDGGIIITASHNPIEYNGLKFINNQALFLEGNEAEKINIYSKEENQNTENTNEGKVITNIPNFPKEHADKILENVDVELIKNKKFKVAVDMINASACVIDPYLFEKLGVELIPFNNIPDGKFKHKPEPNTENLKDIADFVRENHVDLGFAHDPDADRLVTINEHGIVVSEEYTITMCVENILSKNPGRTCVINLSTSQMSRDVAKSHGSECVMTEVGEPNVVKGILAHDAIIGGEGNGGVIYPTVNLVRDSFIGVALILELLAQRDQKLSECVDTFPKYFIKKDKWPIKEGLEKVYIKLKEHFKDAKTIEIDGIRLDFTDKSWLHLHPSNTEPIFRLFGEAETEERINSLFEEAKLTFESN